MIWTAVDAKFVRWYHIDMVFPKYWWGILPLTRGGSHSLVQGSSLQALLVRRDSSIFPLQQISRSESILQLVGHRVHGIMTQS